MGGVIIAMLLVILLVALIHKIRGCKRANTLKAINDNNITMIPTNKNECYVTADNYDLHYNMHGCQ